MRLRALEVAVTVVVGNLVPIVGIVTGRRLELITALHEESITASTR